MEIEFWNWLAFCLPSFDVHGDDFFTVADGFGARFPVGAGHENATRELWNRDEEEEIAAQSLNFYTVQTHTDSTCTYTEFAVSRQIAKTENCCGVEQSVRLGTNCKVFRSICWYQKFSFSKPLHIRATCDEI